MNIRSDFVPDENTLSKDRDSTWNKSKTKCLFQEKNLFYKNRTKHKTPDSLRTFPQIQGQVRLTADESNFQTN